MYHSVTFKDPNTGNQRNTWSEWHLVPTVPPMFETPGVTTKDLSLGLYNGKLDISENNFFSDGSTIQYENREGYFEFYVVDCPYPARVLFTKILNFLHGKYLRATLEDDSKYYYEGRFTVDTYSYNGEGPPTINIHYSVHPYKTSSSSSSVTSL